MFNKSKKLITIIFITTKFIVYKLKVLKNQKVNKLEFNFLRILINNINNI